MVPFPGAGHICLVGGGGGGGLLFGVATFVTVGSMLSFEGNNYSECSFYSNKYGTMRLALFSIKWTRITNHALSFLSVETSQKTKLAWFYGNVAAFLLDHISIT